MSIQIPNRGGDILEWARKITRAVNRHRPIAGPGMRQSTTEDGTVFSSVSGVGKLPVYVKLGLAKPVGPFTGPGNYVLVTFSLKSVVEQAAGVVAPESEDNQDQVWIDKRITSGCVYLPRTG